MDAKTSKIKDIAEILHQPRSKTLSFYLVLLIAVLPIWSIVPAAWAFVVYSLHSGLVWTFAWRGKLLFALALCEVSPMTSSPTHVAITHNFCFKQFYRSSSACIITTYLASLVALHPMSLVTSQNFRPRLGVFSKLAWLLCPMTFRTTKRSETDPEVPRRTL